MVQRGDKYLFFEEMLKRYRQLAEPPVGREHFRKQGDCILTQVEKGRLTPLVYGRMEDWVRQSEAGWSYIGAEECAGNNANETLKPNPKLASSWSRGEGRRITREKIVRTRTCTNAWANAMRIAKDAASGVCEDMVWPTGNGPGLEPRLKRKRIMARTPVKIGLSFHDPGSKSM